MRFGRNVLNVLDGEVHPGTPRPQLTGPSNLILIFLLGIRAILLVRMVVEVAVERKDVKEKIRRRTKRGRINVAMHMSLSIQLPGEKAFFTLKDVDSTTGAKGKLHGLKVAAPPGFDIQRMVDDHRGAWGPTSFDMWQWGRDPANNPKATNSVYQHAGNLAFGAVGAALGINSDELNQAAGFLQDDSQKQWGDQPKRRWLPVMVHRPSRQGFDVFTEGTPPFYGNDPVDHYITEAGFSAIRRGMRIERREVPCEEVGLQN